MEAEELENRMRSILSKPKRRQEDYREGVAANLLLVRWGRMLSEIRKWQDQATSGSNCLHYFLVDFGNSQPLIFHFYIF